METGWKVRALGVVSGVGAVAAALSLAWLIVGILATGTVAGLAVLVFAVSISVTMLKILHRTSQWLQSPAPSDERLAKLCQHHRDGEARESAVFEAVAEIVNAAAPARPTASPAPRCGARRGAELASTR